MERLLDYFVPERYVLSLGIDKHRKTIGGSVIVTGVVKSETVKLHAVGLMVERVLVNGKKHEFKVEDGVLSVFKVPLGDAEVLVGYHGSLNENMEGAYLSTYEYQGSTEVIVATQFESHYAREAFPCVDEPEAKAVFELSLVVPKVEGEMILANMPVAERKKHYKVPDGKYTVFYDDEGKKSASKYIEYQFEPTPRMSTYLLAWVVGRFHGKSVTNKHGVEITTYCALNQDVNSVDFANEVAARSLEFYDDNFREPYPLKKLTQVALPDFEAGAMENWGLVTYRESMLLAGETATLSTKKGVALTVAHELSHQWFGDLVTMKWWDDLWLNESFASVMEYYAVDFIHPEYQIFEGFFTGDAYVALMRDAYSDVQSVHQEVHDPAEIATLFDSAIVYSKGARLMLMLIRLMGWEEFCKGIADYFDKYKYKNTVGDDLWRCLKPYAEFDPGKLMHAFIDRPGYPVITGEDGFREYTQRRFLLDTEKMPKSDWPLPEVTEDMSGHYVLELTEEQFERRLTDFESLGLEEKIRLLIDRNLTMRAGLVQAASLIPLICKFQNESSAAVWSIILSIVTNLKVFFEPGSDEEADFKRFVGKLVAPKLKEIGLTTREGDDENVIRLRAYLLGLDFYAETKGNIEKLAKMYDDDPCKIEPENREAVIDAKLYMEPKMIDVYLEKYQKIAEPEVKFELLFAGTVSRDSEVLEKMLALLDQTEVVKPQDQLFLYVYLYRNPWSRERAGEWLKEHWEYARNLAGDKTVEGYPRYMAGVARTEKEFEEWKDLFLPMREDSALARAIMIGEKEIEARLKLIAKNQREVLESVKIPRLA
ncbi:M1 family metallopeptidase [Candidatus Saccharibacteria bacterium]|nr:M1 family metallopeptidase [Candidatus Saccharibacteria bacterium]